MAERNARQRMLANEGLQLAQALTPVSAVHRGQVNQRDQAILQCSVVLSPNLVQRPPQFDRFRATWFDYRLNFNMLSCVGTMGMRNCLWMVYDTVLCSFT